MIRPLSIAEITGALDRRAPPSTAEDWDNVGLLAGDPTWKTSRAVVSVDLTDDAIDVALKRKARLIVNHHPCIFPSSRGLSRITPRSIAFRAIREGIAVYATHTNFDKCALEVVRDVSAGLGVIPRGRLHDKSSRLLKLVVFVPTTHAERLRTALFGAGAGQIGDYDACSFSIEGEGSFRGSEHSRPFLGKPGRFEKTAEIRVETILPRGLEGQILAAMRRAHPYEEVAYDLYSVEQRPVGPGVVAGLGYGFWGELSKPKPFSALLRDVTKVFGQERFWLTDFTGLHGTRGGAASTSKKPIRKIGFVAGKGASFLDSAIAAGCDLFITGEAGYHVVLEGARKGIAVLELGHRESEVYFLRTARKWLAELGLDTTVIDRPIQRIVQTREDRRTK